MNTNDIKSVVSGVCDFLSINSFIKANRIGFSAFDVTRIVRKLGVKCQHADVRDLISKNYNNDGLKRELVWLDNGVQAYIYAECTLVMNPYDPDWLNNALANSSISLDEIGDYVDGMASCTSQVKASTPKVSKSSKIATSKDSYCTSLTKDKRLNISSDIINPSTKVCDVWIAGDKILLIDENADISVIVNLPVPNSYNKKLYVDSCGRIRVNKNILSRISKKFDKYEVKKNYACSAIEISEVD
jgi:hypothetical protein